MPDDSVENLHQALRHRYRERVQPYGSSWDDEHGFGFTISGINATFSAITFDGTLPPDRLDIQIESLPPGEYL